MLAIIRPDLRADIYVNECKITAGVRVARSLQAGEAVLEDDIVDIETLRFEGVEVPPEAAVVCILSSAWRKGLFFDFAPLGLNRPARAYELEKVLGSYFAYLTNQSVFKLDESQWELLLRQKWFPFVSLPKCILRNVISTVRAGGDVDTQLKSIVDAVRLMAPKMRERWVGAALLRPHLPFLEHALDSFLKEDYLSATGILYVRIEGILRSMHEASGSSSSAGPRCLTETAVGSWAGLVHEYSWLLPHKFKRYLDEVYFAHFESGQPVPMSRHSVGHGVAAAEDFNQKYACIGLLIVDQLRFLLPVARATIAVRGTDKGP
jgi:hypothetical protein